MPDPDPPPPAAKPFRVSPPENGEWILIDPPPAAVPPPPPLRIDDPPPPPSPLPAAAPAAANPAWCGGLALAAAAVIPLVAPDLPGWAGVLERLGLGGALDIDGKRSLNLTPFEPLLAAAAAARLAADLRSGSRSLARTLRRWAACVWPALPLIAAAWLAWPVDGAGQWHGRDGQGRWTPEALLALKTVAQWTGYLLAVPYVFLPLWRETAWRRRLYATLAASAAAAAAWTWMGTPWLLLYGGGGIPNEAGGPLGNRHTYTAVAGVAVCLFSGALAGLWRAEARAARCRGELPRPWMPVALLAPAAWLLGPSLSLGVLAAAVLGAAVTWAAIGRGGAVILAPALAAWLGWGFPRLAAGAVAAAAVSAEGPPAARVADPAGEHHRLLRRSIEPWHESEDASARDGITRRYRRWSGELRAWAARPVWGAGLGRYQKAVGEAMPPQAERGDTRNRETYDVLIDEPLTGGQHLKMATELGTAGLMAWGMLLACLLARAVGSEGPEGRTRCANAAGVLGAAVAMLAGGFWTEWLVRGAGAWVGLVLALSATPENADREA